MQVTSRRRRHDSIQCHPESRARRRSSVMSYLRRRYFAQGAEVTTRYGVSFDRLVMHLWGARRFHRRLSLGSIDYVQDVLHVIACIDGSPSAWKDLAERFEPALVRACRNRLGDIDALLQVRRLFAELRSRSASQSRGGQPTLRWYTGSAPLKTWLAQRLQANLSAVSKGCRGMDASVISRRSSGAATHRLSWAGALSMAELDADPDRPELRLCVDAGWDR